MRNDAAKRKRLILLATVIVLLAAFLFGYVDDWSRDFTTNEAFIEHDAADPTLRPLESDRSTADLLEGVRRAAGRIRNWKYVGEAGDGNTVRVIFVRTSRIWRFKDDVVIRIEDLGDRRVVTGESRSRFGIGDLGQNPRTLRRFLAELRAVLTGAVAPSPRYEPARS
jgi:uncharacterized protein (DUF1499 family)